MHLPTMAPMNLVKQIRALHRRSHHAVHGAAGPARGQACKSTEMLLLAEAGRPLAYGEHPLDLAFFDNCARPVLGFALRGS